MRPYAPPGRSMPGDDVSRIESVRAFLRVLRDRWDPELRRRRREFSTLNRGVSAGEIALRPQFRTSFRHNLIHVNGLSEVGEEKPGGDG